MASSFLGGIMGGYAQGTYTGTSTSNPFGESGLQRMLEQQATQFRAAMEQTGRIGVFTGSDWQIIGTCAGESSPPPEALRDEDDFIELKQQEEVVLAGSLFQD